MPYSNTEEFKAAANLAYSGEVDFYPDADNQPPHEDDGALHVSQYGIRAVFYIGQDLSAKEFNLEVKHILDRLGLPSNSEAFI